MNSTLVRWTSRSLLALAGSLLVAESAFAVACGSIEFPSCGGCEKTFSAAQSLPRGPGCEGCGAICYSRAVTNPEDAKFVAAAEAVNCRDSYHRVTAANFIEADAGMLAEIAQVDPMVALAIDAYSPRNEPRAGSFKRGKMAFPGVPTLKTFQVSTQAVAASGTVDYAMAPLSSSKAYAELFWTSRVLPSGDLEVTFDSDEVTADDVALKSLYPSIRIVLANSSPAKLMGWQLAR